MDYPKYIPAAKKRANRLLEVKRLEKSGKKLEPVTLGTRRIAESFWGKAWCENLESYSDLANRLPRGRTYLRNGCVIDLKIRTGHVDALVSGTEVYEVHVRVKPARHRKKLVKAVRGQIDSTVALLKGEVPPELLEKRYGLFPTPEEIAFTCSCPDVAAMCKHVAAVLYGVGARFDKAPETFFTLRNVELGKLVAPPPAQQLDEDQLEAIFGIELDRS